MPFQRFRPFAASRGCRSYGVLSILTLVLLIFALGAGILAYRALSSLGATAGGSPPPSGAPGSASPTSLPGYHPQPEDELKSVAMVSSSEGWAVGSAYVSGQVYQPLLLHYTGSLWERSTDPSNAALQASSAGLLQVSMVSAQEGWAVGNLEWATHQPAGSDYAGFILHYQHGSWHLQDTFDGALHSLWMLSSTDGWAVGSIGTEIGQSFVLHYDGQSWSFVDVPGAGLASIVMTEPTNGWAFGFLAGRYAGQFSGLLLHDTGNTWRQVTFPFMETFIALAMASTGEGCPLCWREQPALLLPWSLRPITTCLKHQIMLVDSCPAGQHDLVIDQRRGSCATFGYTLNQLPVTALPAQEERRELTHLLWTAVGCGEEDFSPPSLALPAHSPLRQMHPAACLHFLWQMGQMLVTRDPSNPLFVGAGQEPGKQRYLTTQTRLEQADVETVHTVLIAMLRLLKDWPQSWYGSWNGWSNRRNP